MSRAALLVLVVLAAGCAAPKDAPPAPCAAPEPAAAAPAAASATPASMEIVSVEPSKDYPIDFCVVTRESLMEDGHPVAVACNGVEVQFCCNGCVKKFKADPAKYLAVLKEAREAKAAK